MLLLLFNVLAHRAPRRGPATQEVLSVNGLFLTLLTPFLLKDGDLLCSEEPLPSCFPFLSNYHRMTSWGAV